MLPFSKKQPVYREGKHPQFLYYVKSGKVKAYRMNDDGKEYITNLFSAGDYFGYVPLLEDHPYEENAEALDNTELVQIPKEVFLEQLLNDISVARTFIKRIATEVRERKTACCSWPTIRCANAWLTACWPSTTSCTWSSSPMR